MCARARADPITVMLVTGVDFGFLRVYNVTLELFEGILLIIVITVAYFIARVALFLLTSLVILYAAIVKRVALVVVNTLYKSPLLLP